MRHILPLLLRSVPALMISVDSTAVGCMQHKPLRFAQCPLMMCT